MNNVFTKFLCNSSKTNITIHLIQSPAGSEPNLVQSALHLPTTKHVYKYLQIELCGQKVHLNFSDSKLIT